MNVATNPMPCLVCGTQLEVRVAAGRRSKKPFIMLICPSDGRHFRGLVGDREYVKRVAEAAGIKESEAPQTPKG